MASLFFLYFSLVLLLLYSAQYFPQCPFFTCGRLGEVRFPFINTNESSGGGCESFILNCTEDPVPKIQFHGQGRWYPVERLSYFQRIIVISDPELQSQLESNPICKKPQIFHDDILASLGKFTNCIDDYDLYFTEEENSSLPILPGSHSKICSTVQLPKPLWWDTSEIVSGFYNPIEVASRWNPGVEPMRNLTVLWGANYSFSREILPPCIQCLHDREGLCLQNQNATLLLGGLKDQTPSPPPAVPTWSPGLSPARQPTSEGSGEDPWFTSFAGKKGKGRKIAIVLSISTSAIVLIMIILCYCLRKGDLATSSVVFWKRTKNAPLFEDFLQCHAFLTPKGYSYSDVKRMTKSFKDKLGEGGYGGVFKGKLPDGRFVAVKVLKESKGSGEDFINEVASISRTAHVNIVRLLGFCSEGSSRALVYEFMPNGSLDKFIYNKSCSILNLEMLYEIAIGIARGLEYLHRGCNTRIVHFDIKPHNILLDENFCPKISDFGLAKLCQRKDSIISMLGARGTIGYIAPELVCINYGGVSHKSDVYSYGMMVLEMVGGRHNIEVDVDRTSEIYFPYWIRQRLLQEEEDLGLLHGLESEAEREIAKKMSVVGLWCIQTNPCDRPSISRVLEMLAGSLDSLETPPKPFLYSPKRSPVESSSN